MMSVDLSKATSIEDLRRIAMRRVPRAFFQYADHGSYTQSTLRANRADFEAIKLNQRVGIDMSARDLTTTMLGEPVALPFGLAPVGLTGMQSGDGEIAACRAAHAAGIPFILSTMSICSIEDVAESVDKPFWFQLYVIRDRGVVREMIARAKAAKCSALMVTLDLTMLGQRHCDVKNGLSVPIKISPANLIDVASKPAWVASVLRGKRKTFGNLAGYVKGMEGGDVGSLAAWISKQFDPSLNWRDLEWIAGEWGGKIVLKGIMDPRDAKIAATTGAKAIVVSNHGGRQLDGAPSSIAALPPIVDSVGNDIEVMLDSGIRTGMDIVRALARGAKSVLLGRAYIYGLGAAGQAGVTRAIEILRNELDITMGLTATASVRDVGSDVIVC